MDALIRDVLHMAHVDGEAQMECFAVEDVLREAIGNLQEQLDEAAAQIVIDPSLPKFLGPRLVVRQVFQNLISNAVKYRHRDRVPEIHIASERRDHAWVFSVADNGQGIAPEYHDRIFEWFSRVPNTAATGSGVGLASSDRMLQRVGGRIWVESRTGQGSTFYFSVPSSNQAADC